MTDLSISDTCNAAADLIEVRGWRRGSDGWRGNDELCLEGAIAAAAGVNAESYGRLGLYSCPVYWAVADYLDRQPIPKVAPIKDALWMWNDEKSRTAEQVIATLRAVAVIHAAREDETATADGVPIALAPVPSEVRA